MNEVRLPQTSAESQAYIDGETPWPHDRRESPYAACIRVAPSYDPTYDVRHIEAYMRLEHSTLDGLVIWQFEEEVELAIGCINAGGVEAAEALAQSFGLTR